MELAFAGKLFELIVVFDELYGLTIVGHGSSFDSRQQ
jgi:hypothetical protein